MLSSALLFLSLLTAAAAGKAGLDWPWYNAPLDPGLFNTGGSKVVAIQDWETYQPPSSDGDGGLSFIGRQRCTDCDSSPISQLAPRLQAQGWEAIYTLNEPDINGISASEAASWYIEYINPLPTKKALPAITSSTDPNQGLGWLSQMISACAGKCDYDYIDAHWYGDSFSEFQTYVESVHAKFPNNQIVITEFALQNQNIAGGQADQIAFFTQAISFLENACYIELYFPFVATSPSLLQANDPAAASSIGTGSCLYNDDKSISAVGKLLL